LLRWFLKSGMPFLMEVAERTDADRKGGHLARREGRLVLRERAQCPEEDLGSFRDVNRHRYFNTNNVWIRLDSLKEVLEKMVASALPVIRNRKRLDPRDAGSPEVLQLETAMGRPLNVSKAPAPWSCPAGGSHPSRPRRPPGVVVGCV
jgi:UDP-N-acetylglucosamine pyrophosphorylase